MYSFIFNTIMLYLHILFQIPDLVISFSNLCFVSAYENQQDYNGQKCLYIFHGIKSWKTFQFKCIIIFQIGLLWLHLMLHCICSYMNNNYVKSIILENRIQLVEERTWNQESGNLKLGYSSTLNMLYDLKCLGVISNLNKITKKINQRFLSAMTFYDSDSFIIMRTL